MLLTKKLTIRVTSNMCKYYRNLGYKFKCNDKIEIDIKDLPKGSAYKVNIQCDGCGKELSVIYEDYIKRSINGKYYCKKCKSIKTRKTCIEKYGVDNPFKVKDIQEKQKETVRERYGVDNVFQNEEIKSKIKDSLIRKYRVDHPLRNNKIKEQVIQKAQITMFKNGYQMCSKNQKILHFLYGGKLNYLFDRLWLDIYFIEYGIYCEYDGSGHDIEVKYGKLTEKEFKEKEIKRYKFLKSKGLKEFRIISRKDYLPPKEVLLSIKDYAFNVLNNNLSDFIIFDIDKKEIRYCNSLISYDFNLPINKAS